MTNKLKKKKTPFAITKTLQQKEKENLGLLIALSEDNLRCIAFGNRFGPNGGLERGE